MRLTNSADPYPGRIVLRSLYGLWIRQTRQSDWQLHDVQVTSCTTVGYSGWCAVGHFVGLPSHSTFIAGKGFPVLTLRLCGYMRCDERRLSICVSGRLPLRRESRGVNIPVARAIWDGVGRTRFCLLVGFAMASARILDMLASYRETRNTASSSFET